MYLRLGHAKTNLLKVNSDCLPRIVTHRHIIAKVSFKTELHDLFWFVPVLIEKQHMHA